MNEIHTEEQEQAYRSRDRRGYHPDKLKKCFICVKKGHVAKDCWFRNKRSQEQQRNRNAKSSTNHHKSNFRNRTNQISSTPKEVAFNSYIDEGSDVSTDSNGEKRSLCVDSGCTTHLSPHLDWMEDVVPYEREIDLAEKDKITNSTAKGNIGMTTSTGQEFSIVQIRDVLHVPNLRSNLLSVCELTKRGNTIIFNNEGAKIFNKENNLIAEAQIKDRMFITEAGLRIDNSRKPDNAMATSDTSNDKISIWHRRLNHLNQAYMKEMTQGNLVYGHDIKYRNLPECDSCIMGKLSREPYNPVTRNNTTEPLELIHMDLCGPMANKSLGGSRYFFVLVDDFSKRTFVYFLKTKDETFDRFRYFKARVENELNLKIKDVRTDNGTEFINDKFKGFLIKNGIHHQLTTTYSPQSNGVAERINRPLVETARTLLIDSMLPMPFWAEAGATAAYVKNCTPHKSLRHATPMEKWKGRKPSIRYLRIFGCLVYWPTNKRRRNKFSPKISQESEAAVHASYVLLEMIAKHSKPFTEGDFIKECLIKAAEIVCPGSVKTFQAISLSRNTVVERVTDMARNLNDQIKEKSSCFEAFSIACDENIRPGTSNLDNSTDSRQEEPIEEGNLKPGRKKGDTQKVLEERHRAKIRENEIKLQEQGVRQNYEEAMKSQNRNEWIVAMKKELESINEHEVWTLVPREENMKIINSKWVYSMKGKSGMGDPKRKARLVAIGGNQKYGIDYEESFSPVIRKESFRIIVALAAQLNFTIKRLM
ncbi:hypothetical protein LAZ67_11002772 [Cordylochernes scorpioides]|uniref:Retrovirus-related Pol polyprotein from transposon TNT 1-94 n=1 Tax=Cordylochernes scorpioides TaxID=51811 RepID=A0ABY6L1A3_9ARAC|nr:hypothetical protein LAZ67_11002772 [Cordylochernes scorpioides]